ncbi:MAG: ankyrin repeat domain-containing protein [Parvularculales bacterium]
MRQKLTTLPTLFLVAVWPATLAAQDNVLLDEGFWKTATVADVGAALEGGADIEARTKNGWTPLHLAAGNSQSVAAVEVLLDHGVNMEARGLGGGTPLHWAAYQGTAPVVELLLVHGADIEALDESGETPLHSASGSGWNDRLSVVKLLLDRGADIMADSKADLTPLHVVNTPEVVKLFVRRGADINVSNWLRITPLHWAAITARPKVIEALLNHGANGAARDKKGKTPFDYAQGKSIINSGQINEALKDTPVYWRLNEAQYR